MSQAPQSQSSQVHAELHPILKNIVQSYKVVKSTNLRNLLKDSITFLSIIGAYYFVSLSFQNEQGIEEWTGLKFTNRKAQSSIFLVFAFYLISLKMLRTVVHRYETAPPKKAVPLDQQEEKTQTKQPQQQANQHQVSLPLDSYTAMIEQLINLSVYSLVFILCTTSYTYFSIFNKENDIVQIQQINYLVFWFVAACIFYSSGKVLGKLVKIDTFHHFGLAIGIIAIIIEIGLSHGFNMFVFI